MLVIFLLADECESLQCSNITGKSNISINRINFVMSSLSNKSTFQWFGRFVVSLTSLLF